VESADLGGDRQEVGAGGPDVPPALPPMRLMAEKSEISPDRCGRAVARPEARQHDHRLRNPSPRGRQERRSDEEPSDAEETERLKRKKEG